jgi:hypothetical protein
MLFSGSGSRLKNCCEENHQEQRGEMEAVLLTSAELVMISLNDSKKPMPQIIIED